MERIIIIYVYTCNSTLYLGYDRDVGLQSCMHVTSLPVSHAASKAFSSVVHLLFFSPLTLFCSLMNMNGC